MGSLLCIVAICVGLTGSTEPRTIVVPRDQTPFTVTLADIVRLSGHGISGAQVTITVKGPAKVTAENEITKRANGQPVVGLDVREFEIKPVGKGKVTATITVTPPTGARKTTATYTFTVQ